MQEALRDKPTVIHKIHHRLTHSRDAQGAALSVFGLMALILVAVYLSKMWRDKSSLAYMGKQAINYEQNTKKVEILVKGTRLVCICLDCHLISNHLYLFQTCLKSGLAPLQGSSAAEEGENMPRDSESLPTAETV